MDSDLLLQADVILSKCGRPQVSGASAVPLFKAFLMPMTLEPGETVTFIKEVTGETTWALRSISSSLGSDNTPQGVRLQIQLPNGRYLFGGKNGIDAGQFAWIGSWRYLQDPPLECQPGDKIRVTLSDVGALATTFVLNLLFEGTYLYYLKGAAPAGPELVSDTPRYEGIVNENILAPCYSAGVGPETPIGYDDEFFTYASDPLTITIGAAIRTGTLKVNIDNGLDFHCRRFLFQVEGDATATAGAFLGRIRAGSGYALCDNYMDLARYIGGAETPKDWRIRGGDEIYVDLTLADEAGTGDLTFTAFFEGVRRRKL